MKYKTKHRSEVLACFEAGKHYSAKDVLAELERRAYHIAPATIYRQLEALVAEGSLLVSVPAAGHSACYELSPLVGCADEHTGSQYHARCEVCGDILHVSCTELNALKVHLSQEHGFELDVRQLVLVGRCKKCQESDVESNT